MFFHIDVFYQNLSNTKGYIKIENGKGKFKMPENAAYISGFFYNEKLERDSKLYGRFVYDKNNKPVMNAYQEQSKNQESLKKELLNHPNNTTIYAKRIETLRNEAYLGKVSDSLVKSTAKKYLSKLKPTISSMRVGDLYTLSVLYSNSGNIEKSKKVLITLLEKYPNSLFVGKAKDQIWFMNEAFNRVKTNSEKKILILEDFFLDSLDQYIAKEHPHSPAGVWSSYLQSFKHSRAKKNHKNKDITQNLYYHFNHLDSTYINLVEYMINIKLRENDLDSAKILAQRYEQYVKKGLWKHFLITSSNSKSGKVNLHTDSIRYLALAHKLLAEIDGLKGDYQDAINHLDIASIAWQSNKKDAFFYTNFKNFQYKKASLQRKLQQPFEALKTYSELYQELKDERILDSIKLVFEEQDQVEDYKNYIENLKNNTKEVKKELKIVPEFSIKDTKGNLYTDKNLKGAVVVLNFWGVHCSPCVREIPVMNEFWEATQGHEIVYLAITRDKALAVERFGRRQKEIFKFPVVATNQAFFDKFGVQLIPTQIIINPKGEIIY